MATDRQRFWAGSGASARPPKLTPRQRDDIRQRLADGETPQALAAEYRVHRTTITRYR